MKSTSVCKIIAAKKLNISAVDQHTGKRVRTETF